MPAAKPRLPDPALAEEAEGLIPVCGLDSSLSPQRGLGMAGQGCSSMLQQLMSFDAQTLRCWKTDAEMERKGKHLIPLNLSCSRLWFPSSDPSPKVS